MFSNLISIDQNIISQYPLGHDNMVFLTPVFFFGGIVSHLFFFKSGERHLHPERYIHTFFLAVALSVLSYMHLRPSPLASAIIYTAKLAGWYLGGLYSSLASFRLCFNPLNKFPGPFWARLSSLDHVFRVGRRKDSHYQLLKLHQEYGQIVRIGPNDLSITNADFVQVVSSAQSRCTRSAFYDMSHPITSLHVTRDPVEHAQRRRVWSKAFSEAALRGYESRVQRYNEQLLKKIETFNGIVLV